MNYASLVESQRAFFRAGRTLGLSFRLDALRRLRRAIVSNEAALAAALHEDLGKPPMQAYASEIGFVLSDIDHAIRHLSDWMRPRRRAVPPMAWPGRGSLHPEPYGVALIVGPWNYPFQLLFSPLVGALAAGNCACLKPSEYAPRTSQAAARLVVDAFAPECVSVTQGGREAAEALLRERFDFIFFTGSTRVGREVMAAAARNLTPVTLELGGKSPCIVCADARLDVAARRILWGKCLNAGQTCVAPDYVLVQAGVRDALADSLRRALQQFFGGAPEKSEHFGRIVNRAHFDRLVRYLADGRVIVGGERDADSLFLAPTVLADAPADSPVMQDEIFGPILPLAEFGDLDEVLRVLAARPKPLALYLFTENRRVQKRVVAETSSGGVCINDTVSHILGKNLPFGGVGDSGMGQYRGKAGFDCFTHYKSVLRRGTLLDPGFRYPPASPPPGALRRLLGPMLGR